jgi:hypothetical protein
MLEQSYDWVTAISLRRVASALLLSTVLSGCSFLFVDGPPSSHKQLPYFECSSGKGWPTVDLVYGGLVGIESIALFSASSDFSSSSSDVKSMAAVAAGEAVLFIASAVYGYGKTSDCREAKDELMKRLYRQQMGPGFGPGPGYAPYPPQPDPWATPPSGDFDSPNAPSSTPATGSQPSPKRKP